MDHIFIGELIDGDATVSEYMDWYLERTVKFITRLGVLYGHLVSIVILLYLHFLFGHAFFLLVVDVIVIVVIMLYFFSSNGCYFSSSS